MKKIILLFSVLVVSLFTCAQTPVFKYSFTNGSFLDESGQNNHALNSGATTAIDRFNRQNSAVNTSTGCFRNPNSFSFQSLSVSLWFKTDLYLATTQYLFENYDEINDYGIKLTLYNNTISFTAKKNGGTAISISSQNNAFIDGQWHHLVAVVENVGSYALYKLYIDNINVTTTGNAPIILDQYKTQFGFTFGDNWYTYYPYNTNFKGDIDDVSVYNTALTISQINEIFNYRPTIKIASFSYDASGNRANRTMQTIELGLPTKSGSKNNSEEKEVKEEEYAFQKLADGNVRIYPNPTQGELKVSLEGFETTEGISLMLYNIQGQLIENKEIVSNLSELDLTSQASGIYFLKLVRGNEKLDYKIIKH